MLFSLGRARGEGGIEKGAKGGSGRIVQQNKLLPFWSVREKGGPTFFLIGKGKLLSLRTYSRRVEKRIRG